MAVAGCKKSLRLNVHVQVHIHSSNTEILSGPRGTKYYNDINEAKIVVIVSP